MKTVNVTPFQLLQWKHAISLEEKGIKNSRGSVNAHVGRVFGLKPRTPRRHTLALVETCLEACKANRVPPESIVGIEMED